MNIRLAERIAKGLLKRHNLYEWGFEYSRDKKAFGRCIHTYKKITLSKAMTKLNSLPNVKETILHEIAHAIAGPQQGHNLIWQGIAQRIGSTGSKYWDDDTRSKQLGQVIGAYSGFTRCLDCHKQTGQYFRKPRIQYKRCSMCYRQDTTKGILEWVKL